MKSTRAILLDLALKATALVSANRPEPRGPRTQGLLEIAREATSVMGQRPDQLELCALSGATERNHTDQSLAVISAAIGLCVAAGVPRADINQAFNDHARGGAEDDGGQRKDIEAAAAHAAIQLAGFAQRRGFDLEISVAVAWAQRDLS